jgi:hypothetical protein
MHDVATMAIAVLSLSRVTTKVDGILVLPGQGEYGRLRSAIAAWEANPQIRLLLVAGHTRTEPQYEEFTLDRLADFGLTRREGVVIQAEARNTPAQADWMTAQVKSLGISSLALFVTPYHLLRGYLTMVQGFNRHHLRPVPIIPWPVEHSLDTPSPQNRVSYWDLIPGELERIIEYQAKGDVATKAALMSYLEFIWDIWAPLANLDVLYRN